MYKVFGRHISKWKFVLVAGDAVAYCLSVLAALYLNPMVGVKTGEFLVQYGSSLSLIGLTYLVVFYIADIYDYQNDYRRWRHITQVTLASLVGTLVVIVLFYFPLGAFVGRTQLIIQTGIFIGLLLLWRYTFSAVALPQRLDRNLLILGAGACGQRLLEAIRKRPKSGMTPVGFVDDDPGKVGTVIEGLPVLGNSLHLPEIIQAYKANLIVVAITHEKSPLLVNTLTKLSWNGCRFMEMPNLYEFLTGKIPIEHIHNFWFLLQSFQTSKIYYRHIKRLMDLGLALIGLALTLPLFPLIALAIKLTSPGKVFFLQDRLGLNGKPFQIIKFRTMVEDAECQGPQWATKNDPRVTPVGCILRKLRLDELPQLINIIMGDMSFIGPRPERACYVQEFQEEVPERRPGRRADDPHHLEVIIGYREKVPYYSYRMLVKPGITGWAQVMYSYTSSLGETKEKLKYDLFYIKNMGFFLDLAILLKTIRIVLFGRGT
jgi:exopolysaccharide biosynthesis polyprenyl glycosylphosphotransferase